MKTAISIPDQVFAAADNLAERLGVSRSELYSNAVREFVNKNRNIDVTKQLNEVYSEEAASLCLGPSLDSSLDNELKKIQYNSLDKDVW